MHLLLTRPAIDSMRTAKNLAADGLKVTCHPVLIIEPTPIDDAEKFDNFCTIVLTSANAARVFARFARAHHQAYCVGQYTATTAATPDHPQHQTYAEIFCAHGALTELVALLNRRRPALPMLQVTGAPAGTTRLQNLLKTQWSEGAQRLEARQFYCARASSTPLPNAIVHALRHADIDAVAHYSPHSAQSFARMCAQSGVTLAALDSMIHFCISANTAATLPQPCHTKIAPQPNNSAMLTMIKKFASGPAR